jgi:hypothetical protein
MVAVSIRRTAIGTLLAAGLAAPGLAEETSSKAAGELVGLMTSRNLQAIAAEDPASPGRFVAAMLVPDVQLLAVAGSSTSPDYLRAMIAQGNYSEAYSTLHAAVVPDSKIFFQDMGCDGLAGDEGESIDIMYERNSQQTIFNRDWKGQKLSKSAYEEKVQKADAQYSQLLTLLATVLRSPAQPTGASSGR